VAAVAEDPKETEVVDVLVVNPNQGVVFLEEVEAHQVAEEVLLVVVSKAVVFQAENQALEVTEIVEIANQQEA
jgi:hypothetical protein